MSREIPSYLRLHRAESVERRRRPSEPDTASRFWQTFAEATGWCLRPKHQRAAAGLLANVGGTSVMSSDDADGMPAVPQESAMRLADAAEALTSRLAVAEETIRRQEARLAVAEAARVAAPDAEGAPATAGETDLAAALAAILAQGAEAARCDAAGLYILDEETSQLKLRAASGLPETRLSDPPRQLRGSLGDLEALIGNVVTLDDAAAMPQWQSPEACASALCVAVSVAGTPLGTLWMWSSRPTEFSGAEKAAAKLTASLISAQLTSDTLSRRAAAATRAVRPLRAAAAWQQRQQPIDVSPAPDWQVSGWTEAPRALAASWYHWDVLPDGMIAMVIAEAHADGLDAAMIAATARSAWQSHAGYRHDPAQMLRRVGDTLWQTNTGDQLVSLLYAQIDPETGEGMMASAGSLGGMVASRYGFRPLAERSQPLGAQIDLRPRLSRLQLAVGETLLVYTPGLIDAAAVDNQQTRLTQHRVADIVRGSIDVGPGGMLAALRRAAADVKGVATDRTAVALSRG